MANIIQRITLQGAEEIRAQLRALGIAGQEAFDKLAELRRTNEALKEADIHIAKVVASVKNLGDALRNMGTAGAAFGNALSSMFLRLTALAAGLGLSIGKVVNSFKNVGGAAESLEQNAEAVGLNRKQYEGLINALGQSGIRADEAARGLDKVAAFGKTAAEQSDDFRKKQTKLLEELRKGTITNETYTSRLKDLREGLGGAAQIAQRYGIELRDANGDIKDAATLALEFGDGLKRAGTSTLALADAREVFGRSGRKFGQVFGQGSEAINQMIANAQRLAPSLTDSAQKAVLGMDDAFDQLEQTGKSLQRELVSIFAPLLSSGLNAFSEAIANNRYLLIDFAVTLTQQLKPALFDLIAFTESNSFGDLITRGIETARDAVLAFANAIRTIIIPAFRAIYTFAGQVATAINSVFGTNLTAGGVIAAVVLAKITGLFAVFTTGVGFAVSIVRVLIAALPLLAQGFQILFAILRANPIIGVAIAIGTLIGLILRQFPQVRDAIKSAIQDPAAAVQAAWNGLANFFGTFISNLRNIFAAAGLAIMSVWQSSVFDPFRENWAAVQGYAQAAFDYIVELFATAGENFTNNLASVRQAFADAWQFIRDGAQALWDYISQSVTAPFEKIKQVVGDMWTVVKGYFDDLIARAKEFLGLQAAAANSKSAGDGAQKRAGGGYIRGAGTGTSDSILAWLSNGEYVLKARAVAKYGRGLLDDLNNLRFPGYAGGGMVQAAQSILLPAIPRFASGGPVQFAGAGAGGGRSLVLQIGDQQIGGLTATPAAVEQMQRFAAQKSVRSAGRKPVWFRG